MQDLVLETRLGSKCSVSKSATSVIMRYLSNKPFWSFEKDENDRRTDTADRKVNIEAPSPCYFSSKCATNKGANDACNPTTI